MLDGVSDQLHASVALLQEEYPSVPLNRRLDGQQKLDNRRWTTEVGQQKLDNRSWTTEVGQHKLDNISWTTEVGQHKLDNISWTT
jgi:hypothetical protein